jgi:hypothetical protein
LPPTMMSSRCSSMEGSAIEVKVHQLFGDSCLTIDDGSHLYKLIHPRLQDGATVALDFDQVRFFASPFFNAAIGRLLADLDPEFLNQNLKFVRIQPHGMDVVRTVVTFAKRYYGDAEFKKNFDAARDAEAKAG